MPGAARRTSGHGAMASMACSRSGRECRGQGRGRAVGAGPVNLRVGWVLPGPGWSLPGPSAQGCCFPRRVAALDLHWWCGAAIV